MLHVRTQFTYHREHNVFQLQNPTSKLYMDKEMLPAVRNTSIWDTKYAVGAKCRPLIFKHKDTCINIIYGLSNILLGNT